MFVLRIEGDDMSDHERFGMRGVYGGVDRGLIVLCMYLEGSLF